MASWTVGEPRRLTLSESVDRLDVHLVVGRLNVMATDGPARVEVTRIGRSPVAVEHRDGRLVVRQDGIPRRPGPLWWLRSRTLRADVSIAVPAGVVADLRLIDGPVIVSGLRAETTVDVTSGQVTLLGLDGTTNAKLVSGPVEALGVAGDLSMETVSGELVLADGTAGRVRASTVSGAITCDLDSAWHSEVRLGTTSGSVTVRVPEDSDLTVHLHTGSGRITSAFPQVRPGTRLWSATGHGVLGAGQGKLWVDSASGSIALLARPVDRDGFGPAPKTGRDGPGGEEVDP
ncbi:DUF4097 family beta strand repeat-containing protein [Micromonospora zhanjiangensis]|uniref:DUF4097 domain-containing protein n=1 Tax=Micromonospora zhanjiangensis TaxID=1522057 RepID=A0ABV8KN28_9ACTN